MEKLGYLIESGVKRIARVGNDCPSCGAKSGQALDAKYFVTQLRRCRKCDLIYRTPTGNAATMARFYERRYSQGFTTDIPSDHELQKLLATGFKRTEKDYSKYIEVLAAIDVRPGMRILDFGCSWGYGSWQLMKEGFVVSSFEIGSGRCRFARERLGITAYDELDLIGGEIDVIFSSHVLEHVPAVGPTISRLWSMLREGGKFVAFTPNGSLLYRAKYPREWRLSWGMVHPNMLDEMYYKNLFKDVPTMLASTPYPLDKIREWASTLRNQVQFDFTGGELLCIAIKKDASMQ